MQTTKLSQNKYIIYLQNNSYLLANYILIAVAFFIPISTTHIKRFFIMLLILTLFTPNIKTKIKNVLLNPVIFSFVLYFLLNLFWIFIAKDSEHALFITKYSIEYLYPILILIFIKREFIPIIISSFLLGVFIGEVVSYDIYFNFNIFDFIPYINPKASPAYPTPFMSHLNYGLFLAFSAGLLLQLFFKERSLLIKSLTLLFIFSLTTNLFINIGRSGYILYIVSISTILYLEYKKTILKYIPLIILSFLSIFYLAYLYSPNFHNKVDQTLSSINKIYNNNDYMSSIGIRFLNYKTATELFQEKPIVGYGTGMHVDVLYERTKQKDEKLAKIIKNYSTTDSQYFDTALQFGLIGLIIFFSIFYHLYRYNYTDKYIKNISRLIIIVFLLYGLQTNFMYFANSSSILFIFFSSLVLTKSSLQEESQRKNILIKFHLFDLFSLLLIYFIAFQVYRLFL